eukprot:1159315-Pelagomonas_calceolata.AAC.8
MPIHAAKHLCRVRWISWSATEHPCLTTGCHGVYWPMKMLDYRYITPLHATKHLHYTNWNSYSALALE